MKLVAAWIVLFDHPLLNRILQTLGRSIGSIKEKF